MLFSVKKFPKTKNWPKFLTYFDQRTEMSQRKEKSRRIQTQEEGAVSTVHPLLPYKYLLRFQKFEDFTVTALRLIKGLNTYNRDTARSSSFQYLPDL